MIPIFWKIHLDYILFIYGFSFIVLGGISLSMEKYPDKHPLPWRWLALFGLCHGISEYFGLVMLDFYEGPWFKSLSLTLLILSYIFLFEFARQGVSKKFIKYWIHLPIWLFLAILAFATPASIDTISRYVIVFPATVLSSLAILTYRQNNYPNNKRLLFISILFLLYGMSAGLIVPTAPFFPASLINQDAFLSFVGIPVQLLRAIFALGLLLTLWSHRIFIQFQKFNELLEKHGRYIVLIIFLFVLVCIFGLVFTNYLGQNKSESIKSYLQKELWLSKKLFQEDIENIHTVLGWMNKSLSIKIFLQGERSEREKELLLKDLIDFRKLLGDDSVVYLINPDGHVFFASDRNRNSLQKDGLEGHNLSFRPYFQQAMQGKHGEYFAYDIVNKMLGYYYATPIYNDQQKIAAVLVVRSSLRNFKTVIINKTRNPFAIL
ncbi:MAG: hypothetical protein HQK53_04335, partial [Oligoflexia bacterium]|nr:hypothetical protein [Oligoflexia bacterium]